MRAPADPAQPSPQSCGIVGVTFRRHRHVRFGVNGGQKLAERCELHIDFAGVAAHRSAAVPPARRSCGREME